jgi:hypothetical protein
LLAIIHRAPLDVMGAPLEPKAVQHAFVQHCCAMPMGHPSGVWRFESLVMPTAGDAIMVRIGQENSVQGMEATSVVSTGYARGDELVASLGVVGPTHMDYASNMASVHAVAQYLGRILSDQ